MRRYLPWNVPYPAPRSGSGVLRAALFCGVFVAIFLWYFRPFGLHSGAYGRNDWLVLGFGLISTAVYAGVAGGLPLVGRRWFVDSRWTLAHQLLFYLLLLFAVATGNGMYINRIQGLAFSWPNYAEIIGQTLALGCLPLTLLLIVQYNLRLRRSLAELRRLRLPEGEEGGAVTSLPILARAEACGNYVYCWENKPGGLQRELRRTTLRALLEEADDPDLIRCHRSHLVNLRWVTGASGNAQGLILELSGGAGTVPVSRTYLAKVRTRLGA